MKNKGKIKIVLIINTLFFVLLIFSLFAVPKTMAAYENVAPGTSVFGNNNYIEYIKGNLPIVLSAPHGGYLEPDEIPDHTQLGTGTDMYSQELCRTIANTLHQRTGKYPHVIISLLDRSKLDPNRESDSSEAFNQNSQLAEQAWHDFHNFIDNAENLAANEYNRAFYVDVHGHSDSLGRIFLGYALSGSDLRRSDDTLLDPAEGYIQQSSLAALFNDRSQSVTFIQLLRGSSSLGYFLENAGYDTVPSPSIEAPTIFQTYYGGGYNVQTHKNSTTISGVQMEIPKSIRYANSSINTEGINEFSQDFSTALISFLELNYPAWKNSHIFSADATANTTVPAAPAGLYVN